MVTTVSIEDISLFSCFDSFDVCFVPPAADHTTVTQSVLGRCPLNGCFTWWTHRTWYFRFFNNNVCFVGAMQFPHFFEIFTVVPLATILDNSFSDKGQTYFFNFSCESFDKRTVVGFSIHTRLLCIQSSTSFTKSLLVQG